MPLITVNSDPEKLWGDQLNIVTDLAVTLPETILAGEAAEITIVGTNVAGLTVVLDPEEITCDGADILIKSSTEDGAFGCVTFADEGEAELTIGYGDVTVTEEVEVGPEPVRSITFTPDRMTVMGEEGGFLMYDFTVTTDKGDDVTADCTYTQSPGNTGLVVDGTTGNIDPNAVPAGDYTVNVTATYGNLTATCTVAMHVEVPLRSISFDSATYSLSGTEGESITGSFTVTTNRGDDVTADCTYSLSPGDTGLTASAGSLDASAVAAGTYSVTLTATYGNLTATATVSMEIEAAVHYITFADPAVKAICVQNWGSDGEITEEQAAAVTSIGTVFQSNTTITSFNELSYFTGMTGIPQNAFKGCTNLTAVTVPTGVTSLGGSAFYGCTKLADITLPSTLTSLGQAAFYGCTTSKNVYISDLAAWCSLQYGNLTASPIYGSPTNRLFLNGTEVTVLTVPSTLTEIGQYSFYSCSYITSATIPNSVTTIGQSAFNGCSGLTSITLGNSVTTIGQSAFQGCTGLTSITLGNSVTTIGQSAFNGCSGLTSITLGNSVTTIGQYAFGGCTGLTSAPALPATLTSLGQSAFNGCYSMAGTIEIPSGVTSFPAGSSSYEGVFNGCESLTGISLPSTLTSIGRYTFRGCRNLVNLYITDMAAWCAVTKNETPFSYSTEGAPPKTTHLFLNGAEVTTLTVPSTITEIKANTFFGCTSITSADISSATTLGESIFKTCASLASVTLPSGITTLPKMMFSGCTSLTSISLPSALTSIGQLAFYACSGLTSITLGNSVTTIGQSAFYRCTSLTAISLPAAMTSIGDSAFTYCSNFASLTVQATTPPSLGSNAFDNTSASLAIYVPSASVATYQAETGWSTYASKITAIPA